MLSKMMSIEQNNIAYISAKESLKVLINTHFPVGQQSIVMGVQPKQAANTAYQYGHIITK